MRWGGVLQPADRFGSPQAEELDAFTRAFNTGLEAALGAALSDDITVEVSSPVRTARPPACSFRSHTMLDAAAAIAFPFLVLSGCKPCTLRVDSSEMGTDAVAAGGQGAERRVRVPRDLERFRDKPMRVAYRQPAADGVSQPTCGPRQAPARRPALPLASPCAAAAAYCAGCSAL